MTTPYKPPATNRRFRILSGPRAGEIHTGCQLGAWDTYDNLLLYNQRGGYGGNDQKWVDLHCNWQTNGEGVWLVSIDNGVRYAMTDVEDLRVPFDKHDREILIGDIVMYAMRDLTVSRLKVDKIEQMNGDTVLKGTDLDDDRRTRNSSPRKCVIISR